VSEQISLAGKEASGTGNMKFMMNGALTIGTLDGANVEIRDAVGPDNFFLFGMDAHQAHDLYKAHYHSSQFIEKSPRLRSALDLIASGFFSPDDPKRFADVVDDMWSEDQFMVCADFDEYVECQERVAAAYRDRPRWLRMVVQNLAHSGRFSSDRTIAQYAEEIWHAKPVNVRDR
jgi:starch phosphorylase